MTPEKGFRLYGAIDDDCVKVIRNLFYSLKQS